MDREVNVGSLTNMSEGRHEAESPEERDKIRDGREFAKD